MNASMTGRERVLSALAHRQPDRVPIDIGGCSFTTMMEGVYDDIMRVTGLSAPKRYFSGKMHTVVVDEPVASRLHVDTVALTLGQPDSFSEVEAPDGSVEDEFQVVWVPASDGRRSPLGNPLASATTSTLDDYRWPDPLDPGRYRGLRERARQLHEESDRAVILTLPIGIVHQTQYLRGYEQWLVDTVLEPEFFDALMDMALDWWLTVAKTALEAAEPYVDVVALGDDVAFQDRTMLEMRRYRRLIKPRHKRMVDFVHSHSRAKVLYHCCGAVKGLVEDFIEIGFDALNPVQVSAAGMDTGELKSLFGDRICFWGGIDTQRVLPTGSPADVREEVRHRIRDLAHGGGYVVAAVHDIQDDVSAANVLAMADATVEFG